MWSQGIAMKELKVKHSFPEWTNDLEYRKNIYIEKHQNYPFTSKYTTFTI